MRVAVFSAKPYDRRFLQAANQAAGAEANAAARIGVRYVDPPELLAATDILRLHCRSPRPPSG